MIDRIAWLILAAIHMIPAMAFFRPDLLRTLYGLDRDNPLHLFMQHRAALFLVVVIVAIWAAAVPDVRRLAVVVLAVSMASFLALYWLAGAPTSLRTIARADTVGVAVLLFAAWRAFSPAS